MAWMVPQLVMPLSRLFFVPPRPEVLLRLWHGQFDHVEAGGLDGRRYCGTLHI
jgi:hypothetical protein